MTIQVSGGRKYLGCPKYRKGTCTQVRRVPMDRADKELLAAVGDALMQDVAWVDTVIAWMRKALLSQATAIPESLAIDRRRLKDVERQIENLVSAMAEGLDHSTAIRDRLGALEHEADALRESIDQQQRLADQPMELPDDKWVYKQLAGLASLLHEDTPAAALLLRKLIGRITAHDVKIRGKKRGYAQLRFRIDAFEALGAALEDHVDVNAANLVSGSTTIGQSPEFVVDVGGPSRVDQLATTIVDPRNKGVPWNEVGRITGISPGNAWTVWKRWLADTVDDSAAA
jgi:hypothetical protein